MENGRVHREAQDQICTMYIDFPLDGNTLNPTVKALKGRPHIFSHLPGGSWPPAAANLRVRLEPSLKFYPTVVLGAPKPLEALEAP